MQDISVRPVFIDSTPLGTDLFEGKSQDRIADSIANHIKTNTKGYKLIGLDGPWGAGKSNVIRILQNKLGDGFHTFIYDAWSHQVDLQRRSFLEELTSDLFKEGTIKGKWSEKLNSLLAKKKEIKTKTIPKLSYAIIFWFVLTFLIPFATTLSEIPKDESVTWKVILSLSPILTGLFVWGVAAILNKKYRNPNVLFQIYQEKELETQINETVSEKEPSVGEFRAWMEDLDKDLNKGLVIVFDNMDRLPPDKIQNLWSSIHTFFSECNYNKIWVIVPFDRAHINKAFKDTSSIDEIGHHFISKTFSVVYTVSPVVLTDWQGFFSVKYKNAFGEMENEEYQKVERIFDLFNDKVTPRKIINFINELVTLKLMWKEEINIKYLSLYVANRETILDDPIKNIIDGQYYHKVRAIFDSDDNIPIYLAAITYNVPVDKANQVVYLRDIEVAIRNKDYEKLRILSKHPDFFQILQDVISKKEFDIESTADSLSNIETADINNEHMAILNSIWQVVVTKQLANAIRELDFKPHYRHLIEHAESRLYHLVSQMLEGFRYAEKSSGDLYYKTLKELNDWVVNCYGDSNIVINRINEKFFDSLNFISFIKAAKEDYEVYKVRCDNDQLDDKLVELLGAKQYDNLLVVTYVSGIYKFPKLKNTIKAIITEGNIESKDIHILMDTYRSIEGNRLEMFSDDKIVSLLNGLDQSNPSYYELVAMRLSRYELYTGENTPNIEVDDIATVKEVAKRIERYATYQDILLKSITWQPKLHILIAKHLTEHDDFGSTLSLQVIIPRFHEIINAIGVPEVTLANKLCEWEDYFPKSINKENLPKVIPTISIYQSFLQIDNVLSNHIFTVACEYLRSLSKEQWLATFSDESSYNFQLLSLLIGNDKISRLTRDALSAYEEVLKTKSKSTDDITFSHQESWKLFSKAAGSEKIASTIVDIRDIFKNTIEITPHKFVFFEELLRELGNLDEDRPNVVRRILNPVIHNKECLNIIVKNANFYIPIILASGDFLHDFIEKFRDQVEVDSTNTTLTEFASKIDISLADSVSISFSKYYTDDEHTIDVTENIKRIIEIEHRLHFLVRNSIFDSDDPNPGQLKKLDIQYLYNNEPKNATFDEGKWVRLP